MNNPNPLIPQGSLLEEKGQRKPHLRIVFLIGAIHVVFIGGLLMQGCRRETPASQAGATNTNTIALPPIDTNLLAELPVPEPMPGGAGGGTNEPRMEPALPMPEPLPQPPPEEPEPVVAKHVVMSGESFSTIGKKYGVSWKAVADANPNVDSRRLRVGQELDLPVNARLAAGGEAPVAPPSEEVYVVQKGDTLTKIAREHGTTVPVLRKANNLKSDRILVGQKLKVPVAAPAMSVTPMTPGGALAPLPGGSGGVPVDTNVPAGARTDSLPTLNR